MRRGLQVEQNYRKVELTGFRHISDRTQRVIHGLRLVQNSLAALAPPPASLRWASPEDALGL